MARSQTQSQTGAIKIHGTQFLSLQELTTNVSVLKDPDNYLTESDFNSFFATIANDLQVKLFEQKKVVNLLIIRLTQFFWYCLVTLNDVRDATDNLKIRPLSEPIHIIIIIIEEKIVLIKFSTMP